MTIARTDRAGKRQREKRKRPQEEGLWRIHVMSPGLREEFQESKIRSNLNRNSFQGNNTKKVDFLTDIKRSVIRTNNTKSKTRYND